MALHPVIQQALALAAGLPAYSEIPIAQARAQAMAPYLALKSPVEVAAVRDLAIDGPGGPLPLRVYTPAGVGPHPLLVFFHGSGFVVLGLDSHDDLCRRLCAGASCVVVSVDYRLAPEHKFPAAPDDCLAATRWAAAHAQAFGADTSRIVLAGDSAGGCLAAVTALRLRDEGGPALHGQLLFYPVTDYPSVLPQSYRTCRTLVPPRIRTPRPCAWRLRQACRRRLWWWRSTTCCATRARPMRAGCRRPALPPCHGVRRA